MKNTTNQHHKGKKAALLALAFPLVLAGAPVQAAQRTYVASETALPSPQIVGIKDSIRQLSKFCLPTTNA